MGAAAIIPAITTVASAAMAQQAASESNRAARRTAQGALDAAGMRNDYLERRHQITRRQISRKTDQQRLQVAREAVVQRGRVKAAAASSGAVAGSGSAYVRLLELNANRDQLQSTISENFSNDMLALQSQTLAGVMDNTIQMENTLRQAQAMSQSEFLSMFTRGIGGLGAGIQIQTGIKSLT